VAIPQHGRTVSLLGVLAGLCDATELLDHIPGLALALPPYDVACSVIWLFFQSPCGASAYDVLLVSAQARLLATSSRRDVFVDELSCRDSLGTGHVDTHIPGILYSFHSVRDVPFSPPHYGIGSGL
jgi:hypothetical protein